MKLDDTLRARLRALAESEHHELDQPARDRVLRAVRARHGHSSPRARGPWLLAAALSALTVLAVVLLREVRVAHTPVRPAPTAVVERPAPAPSAASVPKSPPCGTRDAEFMPAAGGEQRLDLGRLALLSADRFAVLSTRSASTCGIAIELEQGALAVHARELEGTPLTVHTALGSVSVHGTVFEVRMSAGGRRLEVEVDEGVVLFTSPSGERLFVSEGRALVVNAGKPAQLHGLDAQARRALRRTLGLATRTLAATTSEPDLSRTPEPEPSRIWRDGDLPAPHIAPEPGSSRTEDGRPMRKPRVTGSPQGDPSP